MANTLYDRIAETGTCAGAGAVSLAGAIASYRAVGAKLSNGDTGPFLILGDDNTWEHATCTYNSGPNTLTRGAVLDSSTGSQINFAATTVAVFMTPSAAQVGAVPRGGSALQALLKVDGTDFNTAWTTLTPAAVGAAPAFTAFI